MRTFRLGVLAIFIASLGHAGHERIRPNAPTHGSHSVSAIRTELPVVVDGNLDEPAWQAAPISLGFVQRDPAEGQSSSEKTEFRILYTTTTLYIGVICYDSDAQGIRATDRRRDSTLEYDDMLSVVLDTFHDHRNAFLFRTNPLGAQYDALITDEGKSVNVNWDEKWDVAARINSAGWVVEFGIPFKSLRVNDQNGHGWGVDLERVIRRKNEFSYWNSYRRGFSLENLSQAGHLQGIENIETGLRLRVKPYLLGGVSHAVRSTGPVPNAFESRFQNASDGGLEVMKYRITPSLTADVTWNTDFAQTEVDDQEVNLDRFPLFFPEKREFFQEGAGIFDFGIATGENRGSSEMKLFHSRQIGLSPSRQPIPIVGGGRITGNLQGVTLGLLNVQTEALESEGIHPSNYSVVRVKKNILSRSNVGGFVLNREQGGTSDYNRVVGADVDFVLLKYLTVGGFLATSRSPGDSGDNWVSAGGIRWDSDFLNLETAWLVVDPKFRDDLGFIPRKDMRQISPTIALKPRPNTRLLRQVIIRFRSDYTMDQKNHLQSRTNHAGLEFFFQNGSVLGWVPHTFFDTLHEPFHIRTGVATIAPGTYSWWHSGIRFRSNPANRFSYLVNWQPTIGYYKGGSRQGLTLEPRLNVTEQFSFQLKYQLNKVSFPSPMCVDRTVARCGFTDHNVNTRINYNFNNQWLTSTIVQFSNGDHFLGFNFRLNYIFRPGDDFFLIYNDGRRMGGLLDGQKDRTVQAKLTYSFDF
ncbi:MAG: carbohydrate binding family 9 domain-containing protein [Acidobacteria bacterium]|nr:carbohydrate binding family 9 domain-containing protein [Acidobacteriota bacterium]